MGELILEFFDLAFDQDTQPLLRQPLQVSPSSYHHLVKG